MANVFVVVEKNNPVSNEVLVQNAFRHKTREEAETTRKQLPKPDEYEVKQIEV
jgi:hypothetical protein